MKDWSDARMLETYYHPRILQSFIVSQISTYIILADYASFGPK